MQQTNTFKKENFSYSGGFLTYNDGDDRHFIARFKYVPKSSAMKFKNFLIKSFSKAEYLERVKQEAPLKILESKGYCSPELARLAKRYGYPATLEGAYQAILDYTNEDLVRMGEKPITAKEGKKFLKSA
jgi:hypothetical protein